MNANFKGVNVVLSDKAADDIWDKIDQIDDKDEEQDAKDIEQDEAIAGKLDKDDGMGLIDEKFGGLDNAVEQLGEQVAGLAETVDDLSGQTSEEIGEISGDLSELTDKFDTVLDNAYVYQEDVLWSAPGGWDKVHITLSERPGNFDLIDVYYRISSSSVSEVKTFRADVFTSSPEFYGLIIEDTGDNEFVYMDGFKLVLTNPYTETEYEIQDKIDLELNVNAMNISKFDKSYHSIGKIVGRKRIKLADLLPSQGE